MSLFSATRDGVCLTYCLLRIVMLVHFGMGFVFLCEDHLREGLEGGKGIFGMLWRYWLIREPSRAAWERCRGEGLRWCGDPHAHFANQCGCRQCKSGKNGPFSSEYRELVARVSVHCKLVTRATHLDAYSDRVQGGVKGSLCSVSAQKNRVNRSGVNHEDNCCFRQCIEDFEESQEERGVRRGRGRDTLGRVAW